MIRSMTAFGNARADLEQGTLALELRSVNSRFLDLYADRLDLFETPIAQPKFVLAAFWHARVHEDPANVWLRERLFEVVGPSGPA